MSRERERRRLERLRGWWQVTDINPYLPELGRTVHSKRLLESTAKRRAERMNSCTPSYNAIAEPMPKAGSTGTKEGV